MSSNEKDKMIDFFREALVKQAVSQHYENDKEVVKKGAVIECSINSEQEALILTFENGEKWRYSHIACGADGMLYYQLNENEN